MTNSHYYYLGLTNLVYYPIISRPQAPETGMFEALPEMRVFLKLTSFVLDDFSGLIVKAIQKGSSFEIQK